MLAGICINLLFISDFITTVKVRTDVKLLCINWLNLLAFFFLAFCIIFTIFDQVALVTEIPLFYNCSELWSVPVVLYWLT